MLTTIGVQPSELPSIVDLARDRLAQISDGVNTQSMQGFLKKSNPYYTQEHNYQWLDENGWLHRTAYVINAKNGAIFQLTVDIAKARDGRHILYATNGKINGVGNVNVNSLKTRGSWQNSNSINNVTQTVESVNTQVALVAGGGLLLYQTRHKKRHHRFNRWFDQPLKGVIAGSAPKRGP